MIVARCFSPCLSKKSKMINRIDSFPLVGSEPKIVGSRKRSTSLQSAPTSNRTCHQHTFLRLLSIYNNHLFHSVYQFLLFYIGILGLEQMLKRPRVSQSSFDADGRRVGGGPPSLLSSKRTSSSSISSKMNTNTTSSSLSTISSNSTATSTTPRTIVRKPLLGRTNHHHHHQSSDKLFASKNHSLTVVRAPIMSGLSCGLSASVLQPFRRPKEERRGKQKQADEALRTSSLGMKRRLDGMKRIQERSGKGIHFQSQPLPKYDEDGNTCGETSEEEEEDDKPFEPLRVWTSPHNGGEPLGLPTRM
jgi:hypothetical protein